MDVSMNKISTHVLDTALGKPAANVAVRLERLHNSEWRLVSSAQTDPDGRCAQLVAHGEELTPGIYRIAFETAAYHAAQNTASLYPFVHVTFLVRAGETHFHIPLLLSPNGYTTYRGS
jgi:5-hydroxyisourate hydrolase